MPSSFSELENDPTSGAWDSRNNIYFSCVEDCNEPIMICDPQGRMTYVNRAWREVYGYSNEEALGQTPRLLRSPHQSQDFYSSMWKTILDPNKGTWKGRLINQSKDGREVPVLLSITPYKDSQGTSVGYMGIALDLSERIALEEQVHHQEKLVTIGELTSGLAHEIGTPIGVIRGRAEMLSMNSALPQGVHQVLEIIIKQADRISSLINTLLRLSRSGGNTAVTPVNVNAVIGEVLDLLREKLTKRQIKCVVNMPGEVLVLGDYDKLEQVLINLLMNAIQAIDQAIEKGLLKEPLLHIEVQTHKESAWVTVQDSGGGIPEPIQKKIFDPFFTTKPAGQGTGLGLSIVSRLMHEMGGQIDLISGDAPGAKFRLTLNQSKTPR